MASTNGHPAYRLVIGLRVTERIEQLRDRAIARRLSQAYAEDLQRVLMRLARDPGGWGRSEADYGSLGIDRRRGRSVFLSVLYTADHKARVVYLHRVRANRRGPLA
jgi:hypothetical protein